MGRMYRAIGKRMFPASAFAGAAMMMLVMVGPAGAGQPTLDELLELGSPEQQREALRDAREAEQTQDEAEHESEAGQERSDESAIDESLRQMLDDDRPADVFAQAIREMGDVSQRLGSRFDPGIETQRMQQDIIDKLDQVIAAAREQQQNESSESGGDPSGGEPDSGDESPAQQADAPTPGDEGEGSVDQWQEVGDQPPSGDDASPGQASDAPDYDEALRELRREWGNLPPRLRDEISEGMNERFSPVYRALTEAYYRELAEQQ